MTIPAPTLIDIAKEAPTAADMARYRVAEGALVDFNPWDFTGWGIDATGGAPLEVLPALTLLGRQWKPLYEQDPRVDPADRLRAQYLQAWAEGSYERDYFREALGTADRLAWDVFRDQERKYLERERHQGSDARHAAFYVLLLGSLKELDSVRGDTRATITAETRNPERARWVLDNLVRFLQTHWALCKVHERTRELLAHRRRAFARHAGIVAIDDFQADDHGDV